MAKLSLGIDCGSTTVKGALYDGEAIIETMIVPTGARPAQRMKEIYDKLYSEDVGYIVTTGYGRELLPEANKKVTEITCHARGAYFLGGGVSGLVDIGGQDSKAVLLDGKGNVQDFLMNDKCAAGTGRFVEMMCRILECDRDELDNFEQKEQIEITSMCTVFAESEIISMLANGAERGDIALGVIRSICRRTAIFASKLPMNGKVFFSGGLARYESFRSRLEEALGKPIVTHPQSQLCGAIGAAVIGYDFMKRAEKK
ncbi:MAG: hypothetical protein IIW34_07660 [Clostridia bacterium]|nr:hypothetical protein [Clostridia bacterium]MBQ2326827.1 hypothetical protein [Clostridia bacterium]MBQ5814009.1 hypothetical protein [Clostridia bacterium]